MRGATQCAQRLKTLVGSLRSTLGRVSPPPGGDAVTQMILGILSRDVPESKAREALDRIRGVVVDYNELRVIRPIELAEMLGDYPDVRLKCEDVSRSLNRVFALNHAVSLEHLAGLPDKEVRAYLDQIDGLEAYTRARIRLLGLRQHAIPLDEARWAYARREQIVDRRCPLAEAQGFLERQIAKDQGLEFVALLRRQAWSEMGSAVRDRRVERIRSVPPDRTARNMLRLLESPVDEVSLEPEPVANPPVEKASVEKPPPARRKRTAPGTGRAASPARQTASPSASRSKSRKPSKPKPKPVRPKAKDQTKRIRAASKKKAAAGKKKKPAKPAGTRSKTGRKTRTRASTGTGKPRARSA